MKMTPFKKMVLVWDFPVRVFHWLLVISFVGAWLTSESEAQQMLHYAFGYAAVVLVLFRVFWGVVGTKYAQFNQFIKGPRATIHHFKLMLIGKQAEGLGHNPAGAVAMLALMVFILLIGLTGYWSVKEFYGDLMNEAHEVVSTVALVLVVIHVFAAIAMSFLQKENLVRSMVTGTKKGLPDEAISSAHYWVGVVLILLFAFSFFMVFSSALPSLTR